jgi:hypothetical protein
MAEPELLFQHLPGRTVENHGNPQPGYLVSGQVSTWDLPSTKVSATRSVLVFRLLVV